MLAYEVLWAIKGLKESHLRDLFESAGYVPSQTLAKAIKTQPVLCNSENINDLKNKINPFLNKLSSCGAFSLTVKGSFQYPRNLKKVQYPLGFLYYKGQLDLINTKCISIIGTRKPSENGVKSTKQLVKDLVCAGFTIMSGLAKGIDTTAHQCTLENKGKTIGVIGTPIDKCYPKENQILQDKIAKECLLVSQVPFYRYEIEPFRNHAHHFPRRNKAMASLSLATVVMDVSEDTLGSKIQAGECLKQNKKLFIHESLFDNPKVHWPAKYEIKGAIRIRSAEDIISELDKGAADPDEYHFHSTQLELI